MTPNFRLRTLGDLRLAHVALGPHAEARAVGAVGVPELHGRLAVGHRADGGTGLELYDAAQRQRVNVGERPTGPAGVNVWDAAGHLRAVLGVGPTDEREASVEFWDADGAYRAGFGVWPGGEAGPELPGGDQPA